MPAPSFMRSCDRRQFQNDNNALDTKPGFGNAEALRTQRLFRSPLSVRLPFETDVGGSYPAALFSQTSPRGAERLQPLLPRFGCALAGADRDREGPFLVASLHDDLDVVAGPL